MQKISITAPKSELRATIETLYDLGVLDIEDHDGDLETGSPFEESERLSTQLVKTRSVLSKLPETKKSQDKNIQDTLEALQGLQEEVKTLEEDKGDIKSEISRLKEKIRYFNQFRGIELNYEDLLGTETLDVFTGKISAERLREETGDIKAYQGDNITAIVYKKDNKDVEKAINRTKKKEVSLQYTDKKGSIEEIISKLKEEKEDKKQSLEEIDHKLQELADEWFTPLKETENFLTKKVEKTEAPIYFATTERAFIAEGWVPKEKYPKLERILKNEIDSIHVSEEDGDNPPVEYNNNKVVEPFESLTDLMARPKYGELDPSFMILLTFPIMFGFMIGDAGYGITSAIVFYGGMKMFPGAAEIFKSLLWCSGFTIFFGLLYGEMFGFQIYESPFYRAYYWSEILYIAAAIGAAHVNIGILLGAYNEYIKHGLLAAILEKGSWIALQISAAIWFFLGTSIGAPLVLLSLIMLYKGEGIEGLVEIPSIISNILSYLRLFGVSMAAYMLATTANSLADPAFAAGGMMGLAGGTLILMVGHTINTFIKIMEGFLQGIRLHYVEHFNWYYEGGGRKYNPFGSKNN